MNVYGVLRKWSLAFILTVAIAGSACAGSRQRVYVRTGPPVAIVDARGNSPGPGYVWVAGFHRWDGRSYVWTPGRWDRPPRARARWSPGHWVHERKGWYFVEGRWR